MGLWCYLRSLKDDLEALMAIGVVTEKGEIAPQFDVVNHKDEVYITKAEALIGYLFYGDFDKLSASDNGLEEILYEFIKMKKAEVERKSLRE